MNPLYLPLPPTTNHLYCNAHSGGRYKTKAYKAWIKEAGWQIQIQRPRKLSGWVVLDLTVERRSKRKQDIANRIKATEDLLVREGIISDDSLVQEVRARWGAKKAVR